MSRAPPSRRSASRSRALSPSDDESPDRRPPPPSPGRRRAPDDLDASPRRRRHSGRGYALPREKPSSRIDLELCVFQGAGSHSWRTAPYDFNRRKIDDRQLWEDIRSIYRSQLQTPWRRLLYFKKIKLIAPISYTANGVPIRQSQKDFPDKHSYMHAFHHPDHIRPLHDWVDFFVDFRMQVSPEKAIGLEFTEGLWAEKLAVVALMISAAIIVVSIVWCVKGGDLQTVFTVMGFVLTFAAALIALVALYFQVTQQN